MQGAADVRGSLRITLEDVSSALNDMMSFMAFNQSAYFRGPEFLGARTLTAFIACRALLYPSAAPRSVWSPEGCFTIFSTSKPSKWAIAGSGCFLQSRQDL